MGESFNWQLSPPSVVRGVVDPHGPAGRSDAAELLGEGGHSQPEPYRASSVVKAALPSARLAGQAGGCVAFYVCVGRRRVSLQPGEDRLVAPSADLRGGRGQPCLP